MDSGQLRGPFYYPGIVLVVAILYFAEDILVPLALGGLLGFVLAPLVQKLQRAGFRRAPATLVVSGLSFFLLGFLCWTVASQFLDLATSLPNHKENLRARMKSLQGPWGPGLGRTAEAIEELSAELFRSATGKKLKPTTATPVEIVEGPGPAYDTLQGVLGSIIKPLATAAVVIVFTVFILLKREDLRDRFLRMIGPSRLSITTQALDDAARRISRYLLMLSVVNGFFGLIIGVGLWLIGVPNAALWGVLAGVLRFVPFLGPWIAATMPVLLSLAVFHTWTQPGLTILLFVVLELISNNVVEPWLYGLHTGLSSFALIVAAVFWTWLWGGIGLLLSTPLTVCLVVAGKYVPQLEFLNILLSDEPALEPGMKLYQRLLAVDSEEAVELIEKHLNDMSLADVCDTMIVPALVLQRRIINGDDWKMRPKS